MNWIEEQNPALTGDRYGSTTPAIFYRGGFHHHTGMAVAGMPQAVEVVHPGVSLTEADSDALRAGMIAKKVSQADVGRLIGRPQGSVGRMLRGKGFIAPGNLAKWRKAVGVANENTNSL